MTTRHLKKPSVFLQEGSLQTMSGTVTPLGGVASTAASSEIGELTSGMVDQSQVYAQQGYGQYDPQQGEYGDVY